MRLKPFFGLLLILANLSYAQENDLVQYIGIDRGLSNNAVTCMYQDYNGFMWFGTYDGLNRYDGYSFKIFRNIIDDTASIGDNHITSIAGDGNHNLWIGCEKGLYVYNPITSKFASPQFKAWNQNSFSPVEKSVPEICSVFNGEYILVAVSGKGLIAFNKNSQEGEQIPLTGVKNKSSYYVASFAFDAKKKIVWVWVSGVGLCRYDVQKKNLHIVSASVKGSECLFVDSKGNLWLGNDQGLFLYNENSNSFSNNIMPPVSKVTQIFEDKKKILWIASDGGGIWTLASGSSQPVPYLSAKGQPLINSNAVYSIYGDNEGRIWVGTLRGGVNLLQQHTNAFMHIRYTESPQNNTANDFILSFCEDKNNNLWIGTDGAGLRYWDRKKNTYIQYLHNASDAGSISSNFITGITRDSQNDLWIATWFGGVNRLKKGSTSFEHFNCFNTQNRSEENNAWLIYEDAQKRLWASTSNNGSLYLFNRLANRFELFDENVVNLQCLIEDSENNFWGGTYGRLIRIDRENKKDQVFQIGRTVRCLHEDRNKNFWVGTDGGGLLLFDRNHGTYKRFTTSDGLPSNTILRILEDDKNNLWLSTYNGLCMFDARSKTFRNFSQSDGLQSNQFSFNAALALRSGEFVFGGINGFNIFHPDSVSNKKEMPPVFLTGLKINNTPVEDKSSYVTKRALDKILQITLPYEQAILSLDFVALEYTGADKIKYAYLLEGWDKNWTYLNNMRTANYSRLSEGNYTFKIKIANADGIWSSETRLLKVIVLPPWFRTWWAYCIYAFAFLGGIYLYIIYNKRQERLKYEIKLAHLEKEREKELTEKKISFFTHISHEFRAPLTLIINPLKDLLAKKNDDREKKEVFMIYRNARRLLSLVDQLLLFKKVESVDQRLNMEQFDLIEACNDVYLSFSQHAKSKKISFSIEKNDDELFVYADKEKIEIILFNLVSNALKYTSAGGSVMLQILQDDKMIRIMVKDSGRGIPAGVGNKLFESFYQVNQTGKASQSGFGIGLYVSQKLALAHNGQISYESRNGAGTTFCLSLPKGRVHFTSGNISEKCESEKQSSMLQELIEEPLLTAEAESDHITEANKSEIIDKLTSDLPAMLIVDDNAEIRSYIKQIFDDTFNIYETEDGADGYEIVMRETPDIVITDIKMNKMDGIELCSKIKNNPSIAHIPVILLTASSSDEIKLKGIEGGAEDYITKPFDKDIIIARVQNILNGRNRLQQYFFNAVTLKPVTHVAGEHKEFVARCIQIIEEHIDNPDFTVNMFCKTIGMSHPALYKKVKAVSGLTVNVFVRYIRLRKAAELLITTNKTITEVAYITGFNDLRYFREQFYELFKINPSEYIKNYRKVLGKGVVSK